MAKHVFVELIWALLMVAALGALVFKAMDPDAILAGYAAREAALFVETLYGVPGDANVALPARLPRLFVIARGGSVRAELEKTPLDLFRVFRAAYYPYMPSDQYPPLDQQVLVYQLAFQKTGRDIQFGGHWQSGVCPPGPSPRGLAGYKVQLVYPPQGTPHGAVDEGEWSRQIVVRLESLLGTKGAVFTDEAPDLVLHLGLHDQPDSGALISASDTPLGARLSCLLAGRLTPQRVAPSVDTGLPLNPLTTRIQFADAASATMTDPFDTFAAAVASAVEEALQ